MDHLAGTRALLIHACKRSHSCDIDMNIQKPGGDKHIPKRWHTRPPSTHFNILSSTQLSISEDELKSKAVNQQRTNCLLNRVMFACVFQSKQSSVRWPCDVDQLSQERPRTHSHPHTQKKHSSSPVSAEPRAWPLCVTQSNRQYLLSSS